MNAPRASWSLTRKCDRGGYGYGYGYEWWITEADGEPAYQALGAGGQLIEVVPSRDLVVVMATEVDLSRAPGAGISPAVLGQVVNDTIAPAVAEVSIVMNNLKRFTVCKVAGHKWQKIAYPPGADGEASGTFLRCQRCGKEDHDAGTVARGTGGIG